MNGLIFTEFMEMVETTWSFDMVDTLIDRSQVGSGGIYTAVGSYPHEEMVALINALAEETQLPIDQIERTFGQYLFSRFMREYPQYFTGIRDSFQFLARIDEIVRPIFRKHFPDNEPPTIQVEQSPGRLSLSNFSAPFFIHLAQGLIEGCISHFGGNEVLQRESVPDLASTKARFVITRSA